MHMLNNYNKPIQSFNVPAELRTTTCRQAVRLISSALLSAVSIFSLINCVPALAVEEAAPSVLPTENIFGNAKMGYLAAKRIPEICSKLFCYCGCDLTDKHSSLLDCFTSDHGVDCNICQEEAILALQLQTQGKKLPEIQKAIDSKYVAEYNSTFDEPSESLKKYREQRLWKPTAAEIANENVVGKTKSGGEKAPESSKADCAIKPTESTTSQKEAKVSTPGTKAGGTAQKHNSCCGHN